MNEERNEYIDRLRKLADLLESKPELILPYEVQKEAIRFYPHSAEETATTAKLFPSKWTKNDPKASDYHATYYILTGKFSGAKVHITTGRDEVCERVQVGTEKVIHAYVEAIPEHTEERPVYEYECREPLLAKAVS